MTDNIVEKIQREHDAILSELDGLIEEAGSEQQQSRAEGFLRMERKLQTHMYAEERVFSPLLAGTLQERIEESLDDHNRIRRELREAFAARSLKPGWRAALAELKTLVRFHVENEEVLLNELGDGFSDADLEGMGRRFEAEKQNYLGALAELSHGSGEAV
ncbi:MAG: hemerythrin domain-containing protein [Methanomicrobiales archaeon]|nr:hemerythrin domain-containing protein [Methanomicrobiales archaeon]MDI6876333.1 hemerythrin domain-containing protein [Methanomicrobiales archaeon]